jgi:hypothetical protein
MCFVLNVLQKRRASKLLFASGIASRIPTRSLDGFMVDKGSFLLVLSLKAKRKAISVLAAGFVFRVQRGPDNRTEWRVFLPLEQSLSLVSW